MSAALKVALILLVFSLLIGLLALLPDTSAYPLPPQFAASLAVYVAYAFAWINVFWFISVWWYIILLNLGLQLTIWIAKQVLRIMSWLVRIFA